jgi:hypothetical protein
LCGVHDPIAVVVPAPVPVLVLAAYTADYFYTDESTTCRTLKYSGPKRGPRRPPTRRRAEGGGDPDGTPPL